MNGRAVSTVYKRLALAAALAAAAVLLGTDPSHAATSVSLAPATAQPNQAVSVVGAGFSAGTDVTIASISLGGEALSNSKINAGSGSPIQVDSAGNFVAIVMVPVTGATLAAGSLTLSITDSEGGQGSATLSIPAPALAVDPANSRVGTSVTVTGSNYPVASLRIGADSPPAVNIYYENKDAAVVKRVATAVPDSAGRFSTTFEVPRGAAVGVANQVKAVTAGGPAAGVFATHTVPAPLVSISPAAGAPETTATVTGINLLAFTPVRNLVFAHVGQLGAITVYTDSAGAVALTFKVPLLDNGAYPVRLQVGETSYIVAFTIQGSWYTPPPPSIDPAEGLALLEGNLIRAWNLDNSTKSWAFYDPDPAFAGLGSLNQLVDGLVYWVQVKADQTAVLNGKERNLFQGWNLITW